MKFIAGALFMSGLCALRTLTEGISNPVSHSLRWRDEQANVTYGVSGSLDVSTLTKAADSILRGK